MIRRFLKHTGRVLLLVGLFTTANLSYANAADSLKRIYEMRLLTFGILGDYYMFSGLEGDTRYNREVEAGVKRIETHISEITKDGSASGKLTTLPSGINKWQTFRQLLDTNRADFLVRGYADARLVSDLVNAALSLNQQLGLAYDELQSSENIQISEWTQHCRKMGLIIQRVTAEYAARSTSDMGQVARIELNKGGMANQVEVFNKLLAELNTAPTPSKRIFKMLDQVGVKWEFIAESIKNHNENTVPFIVSTYGDRISQSLDAIAEHYSGTLTAQTEQPANK